MALDPAGRTVYATLQTGQALVSVNVETNLPLTSAPLSSDGFNLAVAPDGNRVYATTAGGALHVFNAPSLAPVAMLDVGPAANGLVFSPNGQTLFVTSRDAAIVTAINAQTNQIVRTYPLGGRPQRIAISPDGGELYIANETLGLHIVTVVTGTVTTVPFGGTPYGIGVTPDGQQIYLLLATAGQVQVLDRATRNPLHLINVGGTPRNVAFSWDGRLALVTNEVEVVFIR